MLPDFERKLLRILYNFSGQRRRMPVWRELEHKTGRSKGQLIAALRSLEHAEFIRWAQPPNLQSIEILQGWEQPEETVNPADYRTPGGPAGPSYWTEY